MKTKLLAVDVDGTLVCRGRLCPRDADALRRAAAAGIAVCLCTGRTWAEVRPVWLDLGLPQPHAPVICVGGALVVEPQTGRSLYSRSFERDVADELGVHLGGLGYPVMGLVDAWREGFDYYMLGRYDEFPLYRRFFEGRGWKANFVDRLGEPRHARVLRISVLEDPPRSGQVLADIRARFAGRIECDAIYAPNYGIHIVEAFAGGADKFTALLYVGQAIPAGPGAMAAIGDDHNDLAMLRGAGLSATPADAAPELLQAAKMTVRPRGQNAVADFVEHILGGP